MSGTRLGGLRSGPAWPRFALEQDRAGRAAGRVLRVGQERAAVGGRILGTGGDLIDRLRDVAVPHQLVADATVRDARAANQQRHPGRGVVGQVLAARDPMLAPEEPVVRGEDDVGVVEDAAALQSLEQLADRLIDG
jgi:hypothetical protein